MRVLVTGRGGQLVQSLVEEARDHDGIEILPAGRPDLDLADPDTIARAARAISPDVVINAAAYTAVDDAEDNAELAMRINGEAPGRLAAAACENGARVIQISTDYVYDGRSERPYEETFPTNPQSAYGRSKLAGEEAVRAETADHLIIRTAWVYSPFGRNFVRTMMNLARSRDRISVVSDQRGNPSSALDLAVGLFAVLEQWDKGEGTGLGEVYHLAGAGTTSWYEFAVEIMDNCRLAGLPAAAVDPITTAEWPAKAPRPMSSALECRKFARDFGYAMPAWQASVATVVRRIADAEIHAA